MAEQRVKVDHPMPIRLQGMPPREGIVLEENGERVKVQFLDGEGGDGWYDRERVEPL